MDVQEGGSREEQTLAVAESLGLVKEFGHFLGSEEPFEDDSAAEGHTPIHVSGFTLAAGWKAAALKIGL